MARAQQIYLVIADGYARSSFEEKAEAQDYKRDELGGKGAIQAVPFFTSGAWRYGVTITPAAKNGRSTLPRRVYNEQLQHANTRRSCAGAGVRTASGPRGRRRYHCVNCGAKLY
jgi:hypothetical protein